LAYTGEENIRKDSGRVAEQRMWIMRINEDLGELDEVTDNKDKKYEWIVRAIRTEQVRTVKTIFENKPEGRRRRGRPRLI
jgi:hypothetical protein